VVARRDPWGVFDQAEDAPVPMRVRGRDLARAAVAIAAIVGRELAGRPDHGARVIGSARESRSCRLVDRDDGAAALVVAGDDASDGQGHLGSCPCMVSRVVSLFEISVQAES